MEPRFSRGCEQCHHQVASSSADLGVAGVEWHGGGASVVQSTGAPFLSSRSWSAYFTVNVKHGVLRSMVGTAGGSESTTRKMASNRLPSLVP